MTPVDLTRVDRPNSSPEMTGGEMKAIRKRLGLSTVQLGRAFGYVGLDNSISVTIRKYESGVRVLPPWLARLLVMYDEHGVKPEWLETPKAPE